jgi:hypothetical protein
MLVKHSWNGRSGGVGGMIFYQCARRPIGLMFFAALLGCSASPGTVPVSGTVKFENGQPLSAGRIIFQPVGETTQPARGVIASDGSFQLGTFRADDGAVPGVHKVAVIPARPPGASDDPESVVRFMSAVDRRYQRVQTTPLEFTVKDDGSSNHFEVVVQPSK